MIKLPKLKFGTYIKLPIPIRAAQVNDDFAVGTLEGVMKGKPGDYLIIGTAGEMYPCAREIFERTYKPVYPNLIAIPDEKPKKHVRKLQRAKKHHKRHHKPIEPKKRKYHHSPEYRAKRRAKEMKAKGFKLNNGAVEGTVGKIGGKPITGGE